MANPMKGEAQLGEYTLTFNFGAFISLEEKTGKKMPELLATLATGLSTDDVRDYVWAGLQERHKEMSDEAVRALLDEHGYKIPVLAVTKGVTAFFDKPEEKVKNPPKAA